MDNTEHLDEFHEINLQNEMIDLVFGEFGYDPGYDFDEPKIISITDFEIKMMLVKAYTLGSLQVASEYAALIGKK